MRQESETTLSITSCAALSSLAFLSLASTPSALPGRNPQGIHTRTAPREHLRVGERDEDFSYELKTRGPGVPIRAALGGS